MHLACCTPTPLLRSPTLPRMISFPVGPNSTYSSSSMVLKMTFLIILYLLILPFLNFMSYYLRLRRIYVPYYNLSPCVEVSHSTCILCFQISQIALSPLPCTLKTWKVFNTYGTSNAIISSLNLLFVLLANIDHSGAAHLLF